MYEQEERQKPCCEIFGQYQFNVGKRLDMKEYTKCDRTDTRVEVILSADYRYSKAEYAVCRGRGTGALELGCIRFIPPSDFIPLAEYLG